MRKYHPSILHQHTIYIPNLKCQITIGTKNPHWRDSWKMFLNSEHEMSSCLSSCSPGVTSDGIPKLVTTRPSIYIGDEMLEPWSILLSLASTNCQILFARLLASYIYIYIYSSIDQISALTIIARQKSKIGSFFYSISATINLFEL